MSFEIGGFKINKKIFTGTVLLLGWVLSLNLGKLLAPIFSYMELAANSGESQYLINAAVLLVLNNAGRDVLLYIGCFRFAEGLTQITGNKQFGRFLPLNLIPCGYVLLNYLDVFSPHFGVSALMTLFSVWLIQYLTYGMKSDGYKITIQIALIFSTQWLDLVPLLTPYGLGGGELSMSIKTLAELLGCDMFFSIVFLLLFCTNIMFSILLSKLFIGYEKRFTQLNLLRKRERELMQLREQQATDRLYREMQYLVHDLKRPLTTIVGLGDLLSLSKNPEVEKHAKTITSVADKMDKMISEIKTPKARHIIAVSELIDYTMSQVRILPWGHLVRLEIAENVSDLPININLIRVSRVLVNLLDNASRAVSSCDEPMIRLSAARSEDDILISVTDNGPGFAKKQGKSNGSTWGSSGIGLEFVKKTIADTDGRYEQSNVPGGARFSIWIKLYDRNKEE